MFSGEVTTKRLFASIRNTLMAEPIIHRPVPDFRPSSQTVTSASFSAICSNNSVVVVHFWAAWNGADPVMDKRLQEIRHLLPDSTQITSCNIDDPACFDLAKSAGVLNVPWLSAFVGGVYRGSICGLRESDVLARELNAIIKTGGDSGSSRR